MHDDDTALQRPAVLRDLSQDDVSSAVDAQLATSTLLLPAEQLPLARDLDYTTTEQFWRDMLAERLRARRLVTLHGVLLFEWFPRSPGLWYTQRAEWSRRSAVGHTMHLTDEEHSLYLASNPPDPVVYDLYGKTAMLEGGIGSLRLGRRVTPDGALWFMSASSSPHADRGVPLAVTDQDYAAVIGSIVDDGAVLCTVTGMLTSLPDSLLSLYSGYAGVPRLYLRVTQITRAPRRDQPPQGALRANAAVLFTAQERWGEVNATYIDFIPGSTGNLSQRLDWLNYYVRNLHDGTILTDFDEQMTRFPDAVFSLDKIASGTLDRTEISNVANPLRLHPAQIDLLMQQQQRQLVINNFSKGAIVVGDSINVGAGAIVVNRSSLTNALNGTRASYGSDAEQALSELADLVEQSQNPDAAESLNGLTEELAKPEPSKSRLRVWLQAITAALPDIAQVAAAAAKVTSLLM